MAASDARAKGSRRAGAGARLDAEQHMPAGTKPMRESHGSGERGTSLQPHGSGERGTSLQPHGSGERGTFLQPHGSAERLPYGPAMTRSLPLLHRTFLLLNRWFGVPVIRSGLSPAWGTPYGGYFVLLRTRGRTSGRVREAPLGYGIAGGNVYVMAGFGRRTQWLRNIEADPRVELVLPGRALSGVAEEMTDPVERVSGMRAAVVGCGIVGAMTLRVDPRRASDDELLRLTDGIPLVRIRPTGIAAGSWDAGGWGWATLIAVQAILALWWRRGHRRPA